MQTANAFLNAYFQHRDAEKTLSFLTDDVRWTGVLLNEQVCGRDAVRALLLQEFERVPDNVNPHISDLCEQFVTPDASCVIGVVSLRDKHITPVGVEVRVSLVCRIERGVAVICAAHLSLSAIDHSARPVIPPSREPARPRTELESSIAARSYEALLAGVPGGVAVLRVKPNGTIEATYVSDGLCRMLRTTHKGVMAIYGRDAYNGVHPDDKDRLHERFCGLCQTHESVSETYRLRTGLGDYIWVSLRASFVQSVGKDAYYYALYSNVEELKQSELQIRMEREKLRLVLENSPLELWEYDIKKARFLLSDKNGSALLGQDGIVEHAPESMIESGHVREDCVDAYRALHAQVCAGRPRAEAEVAFVRPSAPEGYVVYRILYVTVFDAYGTPIAAQGIAEDITARRVDENRYKESLAYRGILDKQSLMSFRMNLTDNWCGDGRADLPALLSLQEGGTVDSFLRAFAARFVDSPETKQLFSLYKKGTLIQNFERGKTEVSFEHQFRMWDDSIVYLETTMLTLRNPSSGKIEALFFSRDITERRRVSLLLESVIQSEFDLLMDANLTTRHFVTYLGTAKNSEHGMAPRGEDYYDHLTQFARMNIVPDDIDDYLMGLHPGEVRRRLRKQDSYEIAYRQYLHDDTVRYKHVRVFYSDHDAGNVCFVRLDVTSMVKTEQEKQKVLEQALSAEREANLAKSEFLSRISHDVRTPMNAIMGLTGLALRDVNDAFAVEKHLRKIETSSRYLLALLSDILDMSRIEGGNLSLRCASFVFSDFMGAVNVIVQNIASAKDVRYRSDISPGICRLLRGDTLKLEQVLLNVLSNAVKFTPAGGLVTLSVEQTARWADGAMLTFVITDTGIGIDEDFLPHLFEPFAQEYTGRTSRYQGTGLGLAITKNIVTLMGGFIRVYSKKDEGSCFTLQIPLEIPSSAVQGETPRADGVLPRFDGCRALLAEDHPINVEIAKALLEGQGFTVDVAENGQQALDLFAQSLSEQYDVVLMDIRMPVMDGLTAAMRMRSAAHPCAETIPIVAMTANAASEEVTLFKASGMNAYMLKPIDPDTLFGVLEDVLRPAQCPRHPQTMLGLEATP